MGCFSYVQMPILPYVRENGYEENPINYCR